jgi:hypothetical protein
MEEKSKKKEDDGGGRAAVGGRFFYSLFECMNEQFRKFAVDFLIEINELRAADMCEHGK